MSNAPLIIIDGYGFIFRAYHVQPPLLSPDQQPVGAIYGLTSMLLKLINDFQPKYAVVVLDHSSKNFRHKIYADYKAHRPPAPEDLISQLGLIEEVVTALNFKKIVKPGYEADDIIASLAKEATAAKHDSIIVSSDKDLMQLANEHIKLYDPVKNKFITEEDIYKKFGVGAEQVREVQALMGDKSDNIPGVTGIGPKNAANLINQFGDIKNLLANLDQVPSARLQKLLSEQQEQLQISWQLVGLDTQVELDEPLNDLVWQQPEAKIIADFFNKYGFKSLITRAQNLFGITIKYAPVAAIEKPVATELSSQIIEVDSETQLAKIMQVTERYGIVGVCFNSDNTKLSLAINNIIYNISLDNDDLVEQDLFQQAQQDTSLTDAAQQLIEKIFTDPAIKKIIYDLKPLVHRYNKLKLVAFEDLKLIYYTLFAGEDKITLDIIFKKTLPQEIAPEQYAGVMEKCYQEMMQQLVQAKVLDLYRSIDLPLCYLLAAMETTGVEIDAYYLQQLSAELTTKIADIEAAIFSLAGEEFNINSPKQLGVILFEKLKLPFGKASGKASSYVTNASVLEKLQAENYKIADLLLEYRHLTKLKNTYTDALPKQVNAVSGRLHTEFLQTATTTGRLSSINPNVQNIPIRTEIGNKIRAAFIAPKGSKLITADYSQIELRILSHVARIEALQQAFSQNLDIHAQTASQIFEVPIDQINSDLRRRAKAINFGIIYGISAFGLAKQLNIGRQEAASYIDKYFAKYPGIQQYMNDTIAFAKQHGYVTNLLGRKCFLPTINDKNATLRAFGERAAINAPMQSLAADIVKIAMLKVNSELAKQQLQTKMLLQIHDELIFEAPIAEIDQAKQLIKTTMETAYTLDVATEVQVKVGDNWQAME